MTTRRELFIAGGGLCVLGTPLVSMAQQPAKVARIGFLGLSSASSMASRVEAFLAGMRGLGYVDGKNIAIEFRWAEDQYERLAELAAELVRLKVDVLVTHATPGTRAAKAATATIPIVMAASGDAVANGMVASLARPGGNVTGSTFFSPELAAKQIELLKEVLPRIDRVAMFINPDNPALVVERQAMEIAAKSLKFSLNQFEVRTPKAFESAFKSIAASRVDVLWIHRDPMVVANAKAIAELAVKYRLPSTGFNGLAEAGGLIGYGESIVEMFRRAAYFVDRILKGAKPGDLPVERATKFELGINLKTARALGVTIPQSILVRADKVIE